MKFIMLICAMVFSALLSASTALAADQYQTRDQDQVRDQDKDQTRDKDQLRTQDQIRDRDIYGHQLMTREERNSFRQKMMSAKTMEEREQIRKEHHTMMQARAKEKGINLPDEPPANRGPGMGGGMMGPGGGGGGRNR